MSDTTDAAEEGFAPIPLLATSYDFSSLLAAASHAEGLKKEDNRDAAFAVIREKQALDQDVIAGMNAPAIPEGTELGKIETADGRTVEAPVVNPDKPAEETGSPVDTAATKRTRASSTTTQD